MQSLLNVQVPYNFWKKTSDVMPILNYKLSLPVSETIHPTFLINLMEMRVTAPNRFFFLHIANELDLETNKST